MADVKKFGGGKHIPAPGPAIEDFWDFDNEHDLHAMVAEQAAIDAAEQAALKD